MEVTGMKRNGELRQLPLAHGRRPKLEEWWPAPAPAPEPEPEPEPEPGPQPEIWRGREGGEREGKGMKGTGELRQVRCAEGRKLMIARVTAGAEIWKGGEGIGMERNGSKHNGGLG
jgi:hypothetical protein